MRLSRFAERTLLLLTLLLLGWWPFAYRYTSVGIDFEERIDDGIDAVYWRVRWPSDGSILLARIVHQTRSDQSDDPEREPDAFDFGGTLLKPSQPCDAETFWQNLGFWYLDIDAREDHIPDIVKDAERAWVVGVPHSFLLAVCGGGFWLLRQRRTRAGRKPIEGDA